MIKDYTLSCPCHDKVIEGHLIKIHGKGPQVSAGAYVGCPCGCLHRIAFVDKQARLIGLERISVEQQVDVYADMGRPMVKFGCPHCDGVYGTELPPDFDPALGFVFTCPDCHGRFIAVELREREIVTRTLTPDEVVEMTAALGGWQSGAGAFGPDPFGPLGRL